MCPVIIWLMALASTNLKYWLDLCESKEPTNSSLEVQQFTTYITDFIADIKTY